VAVSSVGEKEPGGRLQSEAGGVDQHGGQRRPSVKPLKTMEAPWPWPVGLKQDCASICTRRRRRRAAPSCCVVYSTSATPREVNGACPADDGDDQVTRCLMRAGKLRDEEEGGPCVGDRSRPHASLRSPGLASLRASSDAPPKLRRRLPPRPHTASQISNDGGHETVQSGQCRAVGVSCSLQVQSVSNCIGSQRCKMGHARKVSSHSRPTAL
jgi:hypothetical protein